MKSQKGVALIVSLVVLVVAALLGLSSFQSSQLEEKMAANHRFSVSALQAAEAGVNDMLDAVLDFNYSPGGALFCDDLSTSLSGSGFTGSSGEYVASGDISGGGLVKEYKALMLCAGNGHVVGYSRGVVLDGDGKEVSARRVRVEMVPPGYDAFRSMLSDESVIVNGASTIVGNIHSNGDLSLLIKDKGNIDIQSAGAITASGTADVDGVSGGDTSDCETAICSVSGAAEIDVPSAQDYIDFIVAEYLVEDEGVLSYKAGADEYIKILDQESDGSCSADGLSEPSGFVPNEDIDELNHVKVMDKNFIYYCPGDLSTAGDIDGVTVMAAGNIVHDGSSDIISEESADTLFVSGANITFNGKNDVQTYAAFWAEGEFIQNGHSEIYGSIITGGAITINGSFYYEGVDSGLLYKPVSGHLEGWVELENPSDEDNLSAGEA